MELIEGESPTGQLPLDEALHIARQITDALDYAHEKGVVHRDLKPGNIKIKPDGVVKVLDFGLAKMAPTPGTPTEDSPTLSMAATQAGVILGTAAYMAPEQARGKAVDKRADIWAFGVLLHELLTGKRPFQGEDVTEILASVVKEQADLGRVPAQVRPLIARCLEKDPKKRLRDIGDVWQLLEIAPAASVPHQRARPLPWLIAAVLAIGVGVALWAPWRTAPPEAQPLRFQIYPPEKTTFANNGDNPPAISPDGSKLAFTTLGQDGRVRIWIRDLDALDARVLAGTEEAIYLFWSPDSRFIGFSSGGELKKIAAAGGPAQTLCVCPAANAAWSKEGVIVSTNSQGMMKVSAEGGTVTQLTSVDPSRGEFLHYLPSFLPDGHHFLYLRVSSMPEKGGLFVGSIDAKPEQQTLQRLRGGNATYAGSGRLLIFRAPGLPLMTQAFDADQLKPTGDPTQTIERALSFPTVSTNGVLASGGNGAFGRQLTWFDRQGKPEGTVGAPGGPSDARISPSDGTVAFTRSVPPDIFLYEASRGAYQFTFKLDSQNPVWSPDGSRLAFFSFLGGGNSIYQKAANGVGKEELLNKGETPLRPSDWSRDGHYLFLSAIDPKTKSDIWVMPLSGDKKPFPYLNQDYNENSPRLSPNGQWLAYQSDKSGRYEVYVDTFTGAPSASPAARGNWQVSTNGGTRPVWSRDGKELFFISADRKMMVTEVNNSAANRFDASAAKALFEAHISGDPSNQFDVSKDGRFLMMVPVQQDVSTPITVVINWTAALKK
jgi:Tol biopolymer transport system component